MGLPKRAIMTSLSGFDPCAITKRDGVGLKTMEYRASLLGATLAIASRPQGGTDIRCIVPH